MSSSSAPFSKNTYDSLLGVPTFELTSTDISEGTTMSAPQLSKVYGVEGGEDKSPQLSWNDFPSDTTKSFVVTCYDPDARTAGGFWHWIMYDIPASVTSLESGAAPPPGAKVLNNSAGFAGYCGAAPPPGHGTHRYQFCVTALPVENLSIDEDVQPADFNSNMLDAGIVGRSFLTAHFGR